MNNRKGLTRPARSVIGWSGPECGSPAASLEKSTAFARGCAPRGLSAFHSSTSRYVRHLKMFSGIRHSQQIAPAGCDGRTRPGKASQRPFEAMIQHEDICAQVGKIVGAERGNPMTQPMANRTVWLAASVPKNGERNGISASQRVASIARCMFLWSPLDVRCVCG